MSTLKADTITANTANTDLALRGSGTGDVDIKPGLKVGGAKGIPISELRAGTDGELITWNAAGAPTTVATGAAGQILTSNGAGKKPAFKAVANFGALAKDAVGTDELADAAVTTAKLKSAAVTTVNIAEGAVDSRTIAADVVTTAKLANGAVTTLKLANSAVGSAKIEPGAVDDRAIADNSIGNAKLKFEAVGTDNIKPKAVTIGQQANNTPGKLLSWDSGGLAETVTPGNSGQVLTAVSGQMPEFKTPAAPTLDSTVARRNADNDMGDTAMKRVNLQDVGWVTNNMGIVSSSLGSKSGLLKPGYHSIDLELGNSVNVTVVKGVTHFSFDNPTARDALCGFSMIIDNERGSEVKWPSNVHWEDGTTPVPTAPGINLYVFLTYTGGHIWHGKLIIRNSK